MSNQNHNFEYNCHTLCYQTIVSIKLTLHYFYFFLLLIYRTTVQLIQAIIISSIYYSSIIVLWGFSYHIWAVYCWPVFSYWSGQSELILKLFLGCYCILLWDVSKLDIRISFSRRFVGGHVKGSCVQYIDLIDLKSPPSSSFEPSFVGCWLACIIFIVSAFIDTETCSWVWFQNINGLYPNRTYGFSSPTGLWKVMVRVTVFKFYLSSSILFLESSQFLKFFKFVFL